MSEPAVFPSHGSRRRLPVVVLGVTAAMAVAMAVFWLSNFGTPAVFAFGNRVTPLLLALDGVVFAVVGWMIAMRRPGHSVGWICLAIGLSLCLNTLSTEYAIYSLQTDPGSLPAGELAAWVGNWSWVWPIGLMGCVLVLHFPDGRLPGPGWRPVLWSGVGGMALATTFFAVVPGPLESVQWVDNPLGLEGARPWIEYLSSGFAILAVSVVAAAWSIRSRFVSSSTETRTQIKWFAASASLVAVSYVGQFLYSIATGTLDGGSETHRWFQTLTIAMFGALGASIAIAVLKYRLYDIDRIISRTVSYAVVIAVLAAIYVGLVTAIGSRFESSLSVAASTLAVAALFNPLRKKVQGWVDRHFNRSSYDTEQVMDQFASSLRDEVDAREVVDGWVDVVEETMQPSSVGVWVRE
jgi:hypothetical protein